MSDTPKSEEPLPTQPSVTRHTLKAGREKLEYEARADWITLKKKTRPLAKVFHVAYVVQGAKDPAERPLTFVFNGGPGAASAYLHMGALGPKRVAFGKMGSLAAPPARILDNEESWLPFTDLVFIDPVGTGFSRALDKPEPAEKPAAQKEGEADKENPEFWEVERDLDSLGEFVRSFLSKHKRWTSPCYLAGESYGGYRVAKMARRLQEKHGVGLNGAILISPAIQLGSLMGDDYDFASWMELLPTLAAVAHYHGKSGVSGQKLEKVLSAAEDFAARELLPWLAKGEALGSEEAKRTAKRMADFIGLPAEVVLRAGGRIDTNRFCRTLLRSERKLVGRYDGSATSVDPYPDRDAYDGPDPTLASIDRLFSAGINQHLREALKVGTELDYRLLSMEVNEGWKFGKEKGWPVALGAMDDLRYGMSLNEHMRVFVTHGTFDMVTPYYSSNRLAGLMKLTKEQKGRLVLRHFKGGHMFYSWDESRRAFRDEMAGFYRAKE